MRRPESVSKGSDVTEVNVVDVEVEEEEQQDDVIISRMDRKELEMEVKRLRKEYRKILTLLKRLFNSDKEAFDELKKYTSWHEKESLSSVGKQTVSQEVLQDPLSHHPKSNLTTHRAVTFSDELVVNPLDVNPQNLLRVPPPNINSSPFLGAFGSENENALSKRLCQLDAYLSYKNNSPGASHDEVAQNQAENGVGGITRLVTNSGDYSSRTGSSTSFGRPRSASSHTRNIGNEVYNPDQLTQEVRKHTDEEIQSFLAGRRVLPSPSHPFAQNDIIKVSKSVAGEVRYDEAKNKKTAHQSNKENGKTSLIPPRRDGGGVRGIIANIGGAATMDSDWRKKTPLISQKGTLNWVKGGDLGSGDAYDTKFLSTVEQSSTVRNNTNGNSTAKQQNSPSGAGVAGANNAGLYLTAMKRPMKGYTTSHANKTKQAELATHNEEMGKISMDRRPRRAKSAVAYYTDIVGAVPTAYSSINNICSSSTGATNTTTVQDQQNKSRRLGTSPAATKAHLYPATLIPSSNQIDTPKSEEAAKTTKQDTSRNGHRSASSVNDSSTAVSSWSAATSSRLTRNSVSDAVGGIKSQSQICMKVPKHMESLSEDYKYSTLALQKRIGITISGIVR